MTLRKRMILLKVTVTMMSITLNLMTTHLMITMMLVMKKRTEMRRCTPVKKLELPEMMEVMCSKNARSQSLCHNEKLDQPEKIEVMCSKKRSGRPCDNEFRNEQLCQGRTPIATTINLFF
jgi:hypothetical protein